MSNTATTTNQGTRRLVMMLAAIALIGLLVGIAITEVNSMILLAIAAVVLLPAQIYLNKTKPATR